MASALCRNVFAGPLPVQVRSAHEDRAQCVLRVERRLGLRYDVAGRRSEEIGDGGTALTDVLQPVKSAEALSHDGLCSGHQHCSELHEQTVGIQERKRDVVAISLESSRYA